VRHDPLDRDDLLETLFAAHPRLEDLGHAAGADLLEQLVAPELARRGRDARGRAEARGAETGAGAGSGAGGAAAGADGADTGRGAGGSTGGVFSFRVSPETTSFGRAVFGVGMRPESVSLSSLSTDARDPGSEVREE
jgi:hypothetical protein